MSSLNLFTDPAVTRDTFVGGAVERAHGVGGFQPLPVFDGWDASAALPNGMGVNGAVVRFAWHHGGYLYLSVHSTTTAESGIYRRAIVGTPPTHTTPDGFSSVAAMFGSEARCSFGIFDDVNERVYLTRYTTAGLVGVIGCWKMGDWPFTAGNAQWITMDTTYGSRVAGKIAYYPADLQLNADGSMLYVSAGTSGSVFTLDASDGSLAGEWAYNTVYSSEYTFSLVGHDDENGYPVGGAYPATAGNGAIKTWNATNPASWVAVGTVVSAGPYGVHRNALWGLTPYALYRPNYNWSSTQRGFSRRQVAALGIPSDWIVYFNSTYQYDSWRGLYLAKLDGTDHLRCGVTDQGRLGGIDTRAGNAVFPVAIELGSVGYLLGCSVGTPRQIDVAGASDVEGCPYLQQVTAGSYIASYTATAAMTLRRLLVDLGSDAIDYEMSTHPGKHQFEFNVNGQGWSDPRAGHELLHLDAEINGKGAIPALVKDDVLQIRHTMCPGFFSHFLPQVTAASGAEKSGTTLEIGSLKDIGAPFEVQPVLDFDSALPNAGKTYGRPILMDAHIIKPEITGAEITS